MDQELNFRRAGENRSWLARTAFVAFACGVSAIAQPTITTLSQTVVDQNSAAFTLTVTGTGYNSFSVVQWVNGNFVTNLATTPVLGAPQLAAVVPANLLTSAGTFQIQVANMAASVQTSAQVNFVVAGLSITTSNPLSVLAFGSPFDLTLSGTGFTTNGAAAFSWIPPGSVTPVALSVVGSATDTSVTLSIPGPLTANPGTATIRATRNSLVANYPFPILSSSQYVLSTFVNPANSGTVTGGGIYADGQIATVTATANSGYAFANWTSGNSSTNSVTYNCTPFPVSFAGGTGSQNVSCPGLSGVPANSLSNVILTYSADYQFGSGSVNSIDVNFTPPVISNVAWSPASSDVSNSGGLNSPGVQHASASAIGSITLSSFASPFNVNLVSQVTDGSVASSTGAVQVTYIYTTSSNSLGTANPLNVFMNAAQSVTANFTALIPTITSLVPTVTAATQSILLTVNGTNYTPSSYILFSLNGTTTAVAATYVNSGQLMVTIPSSLTSTTGTATVRVENPETGQISGPASIQLGNLLTLSTISPPSVLAGTGPVTMTITGSGFNANTVVLIGGLTLTPSTFTATQLQVTIPSTITNAATTYGVALRDTASQLMSNPANFVVTIQITASPSPLSVGSTNVTLQVHAAGGFIPGVSQIIWNNYALPTNYVSPQLLTALIPNSDLASATTNFLYVDNGGGVTSNVSAIVVTQITPVITQVNPNSAMQNDPDTVVTITGSGFQTDGGAYTGARVLFTPPGGTPTQLNPSSASTTSLTVTIPHALLATAGNATIAVKNVSDNITSAPATFVIHAAVTITSVSPNPTPAGAGTTLTVAGLNFSSTDTVWIGAPSCQNISCAVALSTTFNSATSLSAVLPGSVIPSTGRYQVYVVSVGNSTSVPLPLTVSLQLTSLNPQQVIQNTSAVQSVVVTAIGGFDSSSTLYFNGQAVPTTVNSATQLTATLPAGTIAAAGTYPIVVRNLSGQFTIQSNALQFVVLPQGQINSISPVSAYAGAAPFTLIVNGTNFVSGSQVSFGSTLLQTTFVSSQVLTAAVPASAIANAGNFSIAVNNASNVINFPVTLQITSLSPASVVAGSGQFNLTVNLLGGVTANSNVYYGGLLLSTISRTTTSITALVPASQVASIGTPAVYVQDLTNQSNTVNHLVSGTISLISLLPAIVDAGSTNVTMQINGSGFDTSTVVSLNSVPVATTVLSATLLQVSVPNSVIAQPANVQVTAFSSATKQTSNALYLAVLTPLSVTAVQPASATAGDPQLLITVTGAGFDPYSYVTWRTGSVVTNLATTFVSGTQLQAIVPVALLANVGTAAVGASDTRGRNSATTVPFTINACSTCGQTTSLHITSLNPNTGVVGSSVQMTITGTGFLNPGSSTSQVRVLFGQSSITPATVTATQITVTIPASLLAQPGNVDVSVALLSDELTSNSLPFTITTGVPYISALSPPSIDLNVSGLTLQVIGSNFQSGSVIYFGGVAVATTYISSSVLATPLPSFSKPGAALVTVVNPSGATSNSVTFTYGRVVTFNLSSLTPGTIAAGSPSFTLLAAGYGFQQGAAINFGGTRLNTTFLYSDSLTATVPASLVANVGLINVWVVNPDGAISNIIQFNVTARPFIISLAPPAASAGSPGITLNVTGGAFLPGAVVKFGTPSLATTFVSSTQLTAVVPSSLLTTPNYIFVTVVNPDGTVSDPATFTIYSFSLTSISPSSATAGGPSFTMTLSGVGFKMGATASFNGSSLPTSFVDAGTLTAIVPATLLTNAGTVNVTVTNPDGAVAGPLPFKILTGLTLTSVNPSSAPAGSPDLAIGVTGSGFVNGAVIQFGGTSIGTTFNSATSLSGSVPANLLAKPGAFTVTVTNPDGTVSNSVNFTVTPPAPPAITSLSPSSAAAGTAQDVTVTVNGSGFAQGAAATFGSASVATAFVSATQLRMVVPSALLAKAGSAAVQVTNPNGDQSNTVSFTITAPLSITSLSPAASWAGAADTVLTVSGTSFASGATVMFGSTALATTFGSSTQLTATIPAAQLAQPGTVIVTVVNPGGGAASNGLPFTIVALPTLSVSANITAAGTNQVVLTLSSPALVDLTGTVTLSFVANAQNTPSGYVDPAMQFAAGGTSINFTIAKGSTTAVFPGNGAFSPGSVAGTLTLTLSKLTAGGDSVLSTPPPSKSFVIAAAAPVLTINSARIINSTTSGFTVEVIGFSDTREISKINFTFASTASIDGGGSFTIDLTSAFNTYFSSAAGLANGGTFKLDIPFTITGADASVVTSATVSLVNSVGASASATATR